MFAKVKEEDIHLATVITIDNACANRESKLGGEAASRSDMTVSTFRNDDGEMGVDESSASNRYDLGLSAMKVVTSGLVRASKWKAGSVGVSKDA